MDSLRQAVIKLANKKPELRTHLLPILDRTAAEDHQAAVDLSTYGSHVQVVIRSDIWGDPRFLRLLHQAGSGNGDAVDHLEMILEGKSQPTVDVIKSALEVAQSRSEGDKVSQGLVQILKNVLKAAKAVLA